MKVTTSLFINAHSPNLKGKCSISVRVTYDRVKKYYPTGINMTPLDFEKTQGKKPRKEFKENALKLQSFEKKAADIINKMQVFTFKAFEKHYYLNRGAKDTINAAFSDYAAHLRISARIGTAVSYECAQSSLNKFKAGTKFIDVTPEFLRRYEAYMIGKGNSITTVGIYLRSLRTIFNNAIGEDMLTKEFYPFGKRRYEIPTGNNIKKALHLTDIGTIYNYKPEPGSMSERAKDYWLFMYLCNGMNVKDMCLLKYEYIKGQVLEFERAKTARTKRKVEPIRVTITEDVNMIINKWGNVRTDGSEYIFPVFTKGLTPERERQLIQQLTGVINDNMKAIAKKLSIQTPCNTYAARHSFSTILQRSGVSISFISEALGHSNVNTTQSYLAGFEDDAKKNITQALTAFKNL